MIVSTLSSYPGKKVVKDLGIVYAFDDNLRFYRNIFKVETYLDHALENLKENAKKKGANGVLGISFSCDDEHKPIVIGTAVVLEDEVHD